MTRKPAAAPRYISDARTIALLASAVRQEIVDTLESLGGEAEVADIARELGRPADGLYYHLELMRKGGVLAVAEEGGARRYRFRHGAGSPLRLDYRGGGAKATQAMQRLVGGMLQIAGRDFAQALADPETVSEGPARELWAARTKSWVSREELVEINRLLERLNALLHGPRREGRDRLVSLCYVLAPVAAQPTRRGETEDAED